jgi:hypothetical protein
MMTHGEKIYHSSSIKLTAFHNKPTWFSLNERDALRWHESGSHGKQITYICQPLSSIASEKDAAEIAKEIWPDSTFIYSMFDKKVGEFDNDEIDRFINKLMQKGFDGSYMEDYDPDDFDGGGSTRSVVIFDGSMVKIVDVLKDDL